MPQEGLGSPESLRQCWVSPAGVSSRRLLRWPRSPPNTCPRESRAKLGQDRPQSPATYWLRCVSQEGPLQSPEAEAPLPPTPRTPHPACLSFAEHLPDARLHHLHQEERHGRGPGLRGRPLHHEAHLPLGAAGRVPHPELRLTPVEGLMRGSQSTLVWGASREAAMGVSFHLKSAILLSSHKIQLHGFVFEAFLRS